MAGGGRGAEMLSVAIRKQLGNFTLDVAFEGPGDGVTALFGPSGAGKSATLAAIGGTSRPDVGHIAIDGRVLVDTASGACVPPQRRRIGWVYQDARLFPHMPVRANLLYGFRRARDRARIGIDEVVDVLAIGHLLDRRVTLLSGGERQRVALGRALLSQPDLLLLDEPLAALDEARKAEILGFIARLKAEFRLPMVYVTHSMAEVQAIADHMVRLDGGSVVAAHPIEGGGIDPDAVGADMVDAVVIGTDGSGRATEVDVGGRRFAVPLLACAPGDRIRISVVKTPAGD